MSGLRFVMQVAFRLVGCLCLWYMPRAETGLRRFFGFYGGDFRSLVTVFPVRCNISPFAALQTTHLIQSIRLLVHSTEGSAFCT